MLTQYSTLDPNQLQWPTSFVQVFYLEDSLDYVKYLTLKMS